MTFIGFLFRALKTFIRVLVDALVRVSFSIRIKVALSVVVVLSVASVVVVIVVVNILPNYFSRPPGEVISPHSPGSKHYPNPCRNGGECPEYDLDDGKNRKARIKLYAVGNMLHWVKNSSANVVDIDNSIATATAVFDKYISEEDVMLAKNVIGIGMSSFDGEIQKDQENLAEKRAKVLIEVACRKGLSCSNGSVGRKRKFHIINFGWYGSESKSKIKRNNGGVVDEDFQRRAILIFVVEKDEDVDLGAAILRHFKSHPLYGLDINNFSRVKGEEAVLVDVP